MKPLRVIFLCWTDPVNFYPFSITLRMLACYDLGFMRSLSPWPVFPNHLEPPVARSLSIQFILQALLDGLSILEKQDFQSELEKIMLFSLKNPMSQTGGVLDKLTFYSELLIDASHVKENELIHCLETMRRALILFKSKMGVWKKMTRGYPQEEMQEQLMQLHSSLSLGFCSYFTALIPFLKEARSDENVLTSLIENREKFNTYLGPKSVEMMLQSFFPAGFDQLRAIIYEGYTRRGFDTFLSSIEPLIDQIQWEVPCHAPEP